MPRAFSQRYGLLQGQVERRCGPLQGAVSALTDLAVVASRLAAVQSQAQWSRFTSGDPGRDSVFGGMSSILPDVFLAPEYAAAADAMRGDEALASFSGDEPLFLSIGGSGQQIDLESALTGLLESA